MVAEKTIEERVLTQGYEKSAVFDVVMGVSTDEPVSTGTLFDQLMELLTETA